MGCCQSRYTQFERNQKRTIPPTPVKSPLLVKTLFKEQAWEQLASLCYDKTEITTPLTLFWAASPKTIGALAITYLAIQSLKDIQIVKEVIDMHMLFILKSIKKGTDDIRENSLILLSSYVECMTDIRLFVLLSYRIFNVLVRFFLCSKPQMRLLCASICSSIYKGRRSAQEAFIYENGGTLLMNLIQRHSDEEENLKKLLGFLENSVVDSSNCPSSDICLRIDATLASDILREIKLKWKKTALEEKIDNLINILIFT